MEDLFLSFGRAGFPEEHRDIMVGGYVSYEVFVSNHESILPDMRGKRHTGCLAANQEQDHARLRHALGRRLGIGARLPLHYPHLPIQKRPQVQIFKNQPSIGTQFLVELFLCGCATLDKKRRPRRRGFVFEDAKFRYGRGAVKVLGTCRRESYQIAKAAPNPQRTQLVVWHWAYLASAFSFAPPPATASSSASSTSTPSISLISKSSLSS